MPERKAYSPPQLVRVELNHEQAILSTCSSTSNNVSSSSVLGFCRTNVNCKRRSTQFGTNSNFGGRLS